MISDNVLIGSCTNVTLNSEENQISWFNNAVISLYGNNPGLAIEYIEKLIDKRPVYEVLYIKARALSFLNRYSDADNMNILMSEILSRENGGKGFDNKFMYSYAYVNEIIGDPCLGAYQAIVMNNPNYITGHINFYNAMKKQQKKLILAEGHELPYLAKVFNETDEKNEYNDILVKTMIEQPEEINKFINTIGKQSLE